MTRIIHVGDEHLGGNYPEKAAASFDFLIEQLWGKDNALKPDLVVSTGDLTDRPLHVHSEHLKPFLKFVKAAECPIVLLQGTPSHEPIGVINNIASVSEGKLSILDRPDAAIVIPGVAVVRGLPALSKPHLKEWLYDSEIDPFDHPDVAIRELLAEINDHWSPGVATPRLLLGHWTVRGCKTATGQTMIGNDLEVSLEDLALANADAVLLGHIHKTQHWDEPVFTSYCGSIYPHDWGELDEKSFTVLEFEGRTLKQWQRIPFPHKGMVKLEMQFTGEQAPDGSWIHVFHDEHLRVSVEDLKVASVSEQEIFVTPLTDKEVKVCYEIPSSLSAIVDDMYIRAHFMEHDIELAAVERTIKPEQRQRIENIGELVTTEQQYNATCEALEVAPRPGAIEKARMMDEQGVTA